MSETEKIIENLNTAKLILCNQQMLTPEMCIRIGQAITDAITLLKEQEGIVPYIDIDEAKCPICKVKLTRQELLGDNVLYEDFFDYCPHCGRKVKWE